MDCSLDYYRACTNKDRRIATEITQKAQSLNTRRATIQLSFPHLHNGNNININVLINKKGKSNGHNDAELRTNVYFKKIFNS